MRLSRARAQAPRSARIRWAVIPFVLVSVAAALSPAARGMVVLYPALALLVAYFAFRRSKAAYLSFVCWLWFLSPLVRRVVDWHASTSASLILTAPFLASLVCVPGLIQHRSALVNRRTTPLLCVLSAIAYGTFVGLAHYQFGSLPTALVAWTTPVLFAIFLISEHQNLTEFANTLESTFLWGLLVMGLYALAQFFLMPPWDAQWMLESNLTSIGLPVPMQVRVFSSMNAPQVFAAFCTAGLLLAIRSQRRIRFFAIPVGFMALILTISRTAWLGFAAGMIYLFFSLTARQRVQIVAIAGSCFLVCVAALQVSEVKELVTNRFASLTDPKHDASYGARVQDYGVVLQNIEDEPFGFGLAAASNQGNGYDSSGQPATVAQQDSTITSVLFSLGWLGTLVFVIAVMILCADIFFSRRSAPSRTTAVKSIILALLLEASLNNVVAGPVGFLTWCCIGLCLADRERASGFVAPGSNKLRKPELNRRRAAFAS